MISTVLAIFLAALFTALVAATTWHHIRNLLFHPIVLVNAIMVYYILLPAWFLLTTGQHHFSHAQPARELLAALSVAIATYTIILIVYHASEIPHPPQLPDVSVADALDVRNIDLRFLRLLGGVGFLTGVFFYIVYVAINGGPVRLLTITPRTAFTGPNTARYKFLAFAGINAGLVCILAGYRPRVLRNDLSTRDYQILSGVLAATFLIVISLRSRMNLVIPAAYLLLYVDRTGRLPRRKLAIGAAALFAVGMSYTFVETLFTARASNPIRIITAGLIDTIRLEVLMKVIAAVPATHPHQLGATFVHIFGIRWPGMPASYGNQLQMIVFGSQSEYITFPAMMLGELYLNFGTIGTLIGGGIFAWLLRTIASVRDHAVSPVAAIVQPLLLLAVVSMLPTSIGWSLRSMWLRIVLPVVAAVGVSHYLTQRVQTRGTPTRERL